MNGLSVRPGIMEITPYVGGDADVAGVERVIKLASNEGALGPSPKAVAAYGDAAASLHRYPDGSAEDLRKALGSHHGLDPARIVCGAGSDELIGLLCRAYAGPGDEVLHSEHGFLMYPIAARTVGATPVAAPETDLTTDVDALLGKVTARTRIVFVANPNNPTGTYLPAAEVARLRAGLPADVLLVLDAAYAEYVSRDDYAPGSELVDGGENVVMTRTFSKLYALGGVRLGWAYCPPVVADVLSRARNPFNVSAPAQAAGRAALADAAFAERSRRHNDTWLAWFTGQMRDLGLEVPTSIGNFVLVRFPDRPGLDAEAADAFLRLRGIITRRMAGYGLADSMRITIGLEDEMRAVAAALKEFLG
ncbi:MAG: histidinol-phosphate transaminase [Rhodospirillales bacterium]|jgi:histidinol-phosphate aminotransferase|nr:histidinol-phosphate transaminase [Rhodospirillales bacterium]MDP6882889.1 histidinol-phosphate transaminase [Rhodospirillales bacterium]